MRISLKHSLSSFGEKENRLYLEEECDRLREDIVSGFGVTSPDIQILKKKRTIN